MKTLEKRHEMEKRTELALQGMKKLNAEELSALLATAADISTSYKRKDYKPGLAEKIAKLRKIIAEVEEKMAKRFKVRWMAADGSTFDNYNDYFEHQLKPLLD